MKLTSEDYIFEDVATSLEQVLRSTKPAWWDLRERLRSWRVRITISELRAISYEHLAAKRRALK